VNRAANSSPSTRSALLSEAEAFRLLVENTTDYAIFTLDPNGHVASWNAGAARIKGWAADEIIGNHFSIFYTPEAKAKAWPDHELKEAARIGRFEDEGWRVRKDGTRFWANVVITALRGADGTLYGFGKVTRDMTERRAHEQQVEKLKTQLEERVVDLAAANHELAQKSAENESFVYSVSHDLRSPLVNLQGFSQELVLTSEELRKLLTDPTVPEQVRTKALALIEGEFAESIGFMRNAVRHLASIIDGLLRLSRIGRVEYQFEPVDVGTVVTDIVSAMHSTVTASGARIEIKPLPIVSADQNAVGQIFANIIGNALKSLDDRRPGLIEIAATDEDPPVFSVKDNGIGIPPEFHAKMFQVFQQVHTGRGRGEGMGLAIVRRIVDRHGGRIWLESKPGEGTTFFFVIGRVARRKE
jgi:PAS domain S-box-containing protein